MFITDIDLGKIYTYHNGTDAPCRVLVIRCDTHIPDVEQSTVLVEAVTSECGPRKTWVAMPHQLQQRDKYEQNINRANERFVRKLKVMGFSAGQIRAIKTRHQELCSAVNEYQRAITTGEE